VDSLAMTTRGKWVATCAIRLSASDMGVQLWDLATGNEGKRLRGATDNIHGGAVSPDGKGIAAAAADKLAWIWLREGGGAPTGDAVYSGSEDGTIRRWPIARMK